MIFTGLVEVAFDHGDRMWWVLCQGFGREAGELGKENAIESEAKVESAGENKAAWAKATRSLGVANCIAAQL